MATYNGRDKHGRAAVWPPGSATLGGYATDMVVHERFGVLIPATYPLEYAGPVMCAGVTLYDPLRKYGATTGTKVGIVGVGGLGQMGIGIAKALGCTVTAISRGETKRDLATRCGADSYISSADAAAMAASAGSLDLVLNTISTDHNYSAYSALLNAGGKHIMMGLNAALAAAMITDKLTCGRSRVKMSAIGGIRATQEVVDLCAQHKIFPTIEKIPVERINAAYTAIERGNDSGVRYVIDMSTLNEEAFQRCTAPPPDLSVKSTGISMGAVLGELAGMLLRGRWM